MREGEGEREGSSETPRLCVCSLSCFLRAAGGGSAAMAAVVAKGTGDHTRVGKRRRGEERERRRTLAKQSEWRTAQ